MNDSHHIFMGQKPLAELPEPPPWRQFQNKHNRTERGATYRPSPEEIELVNAALYLRRPLLITGRPGTGKSSLAYAVAHALGLGDVLVWPITSKSTRQHGLYHYDAIGRLQEAQHRQSAGMTNSAAQDKGEDIGQALRLGPLGTAFIRSQPQRPSVVLIDEIDKGDMDLPNDLLHLFEEGEFEIPELARAHTAGDTGTVEVLAHGSTDKLRVPRDGMVRCAAFPLVILTSNGEREFPPAFQRRCLRLKLEPPNAEKIGEIVEAHLAPLRASDGPVKELIEAFVERRDKQKQEVAIDQLLNALYLLQAQVALPDQSILRQALFAALTE